MEVKKEPKIRIIAKLAPKQDQTGNVPPAPIETAEPRAKITIRPVRKPDEYEPEQKPSGLRIHNMPDAPTKGVTPPAVDFNLSDSDQEEQRPLLYQVTEDSE